jgi:hypothetical protein
MNLQLVLERVHSAWLDHHDQGFAFDRPIETPLGQLLTAPPVLPRRPRQRRHRV